MLEVVQGGIETLVEDWPGRLGHLDNGIAAAGAFDAVALGLGNVTVGNVPGEAGLEITAGYFEAVFKGDGVISLTGCDMTPTLNGEPMPMWQAVRVGPGDQLRVDHFGDVGFRAYLTVAGGVDVPMYLGSKSTCLSEGYGGFEGRKLQPGDVLRTGRPSASLASLEGRRVHSDKVPRYERQHVVRAVPGPNAAPDYATVDGMELLFTKAWKVLLNSNRTACRLEEIPDPDRFFARRDGGVGGSHPSNVLDHAYATRGAMNVCGNTPIILIADAPTLGGYMNALHIIWADLWKIGQCTPGRDYLKFEFCTVEAAQAARTDLDVWLSEASLA